MRAVVCLCVLVAVGCDEVGDGPPDEVYCAEAESFGDPFLFDVEWDYVDEGYGIAIQPAFGQLTDDNGDGRVDDLDRRDIVFTTYFGNKLVALHGDGSGVLFEKEGYWGRAGVAIGDVDGDGRAEIIAATTDYRIVALDAAGQESWQSSASASLEGEVLIADLDADGAQEVIFDGTVLDGETGALRFQIPPIGRRAPRVADLDSDGTLELILGARVYDHHGNLEWLNDTEFGYLGVFAEPAQLDGDVGLETVFVMGDWQASTVAIYDDDGAFIRSFEVPAGNAGKPSVVDVDGDGELEIAVSGIGFVSVHDLDGSELWRAVAQDQTGLKGTRSADIDFDGEPELILADEESVRIFAGVDGTVLYENADHSSSGYTVSVPTVADLDGDGTLEIILASSEWPTTGEHGLSVFSAPGNGWINVCSDE